MDSCGLEPMELENREGAGALTLEAGAEKRGVAEGVSGPLVWAPPAGVLVFDPNRLPNGAAEGRGFCSVAGVLEVAGPGVAGLGENRLWKGLVDLDSVFSCSAAAAGLGLKGLLPVLEGWNNPLAGAAGVSLFWKRDVPLLVEGVNWNPGFDCAGSPFFSSVSFSSVALGVADEVGAPPKRFWKGVAGLVGELGPNRVEVAGAVDVAAGVLVEVDCVAAPKAGVDEFVDPNPKSGFDGDSAVVDGGAPKTEPVPALPALPAAGLPKLVEPPKLGADAPKSGLD